MSDKPGEQIRVYDSKYCNDFANVTENQILQLQIQQIKKQKNADTCLTFQEIKVILLQLIINNQITQQLIKSQLHLNCSCDVIMKMIQSEGNTNANVALFVALITSIIKNSLIQMQRKYLVFQVQFLKENNTIKTYQKIYNKVININQ